LGFCMRRVFLVVGEDGPAHERGTRDQIHWPSSWARRQTRHGAAGGFPVPRSRYGTGCCLRRGTGVCSAENAARGRLRGRRGAVDPRLVEERVSGAFELRRRREAVPRTRGPASRPWRPFRNSDSFRSHTTPCVVIGEPVDSPRQPRALETRYQGRCGDCRYVRAWNAADECPHRFVGWASLSRGSLAGERQFV